MRSWDKAKVRAKADIARITARAKAEAEIWENVENTRKARETKAKNAAKTVERSRSWDEDKEKDKAEISRVNAEARERAGLEDKATVREKNNDVQRSAAEAAANIRAKAKAERRNRDKAEAEARDKAEAEIKEKAEKMRKEREAKEKKESEAMERERACSKEKEKDMAEISRVNDEAR